MENEIKNMRAGMDNLLFRMGKRLFRFNEMGPLISVLILGALLSFGSPYFLTANNLLRVGRQMAYIGILSVGMSFVIASGQIDISVGRIITLVSFCMATLIKNGINPWIAFICGLLVGALCGLFNGSLALLFNVHPMIITLGTLNLYWGLAMGLSKSRPISLLSDSSFYQLAQGRIFSVPIPLIVLISLVILFQIILQKTVYGRHVLAVGSNRHAASYAGIRVKLVLRSTMVLSGLLAGFAGGVAVAHFQSFDPNVGGLLEFNSIGATVIGGGDLMGGYASVVGAFFGTILIGVLNNGLVLMGVGAYWNNFVTGAVIIIAVGVGSIVKQRRK